MTETTQTIMCPHCASTSLSANKKGFNGSKAAVGMLLAGPIGLTAGVSNSNDIDITCLNCGFTFKPGEGATTKEEMKSKKRRILNRQYQEQSAKSTKKIILFGLLLVMIIVFYSMFKSIG